MAQAPAVAPAASTRTVPNTISWDTKAQSFPAGTVAGGWLIQVDGQPDQTVAERGSVARSLPPGDHTATITRLDDQGKPLGDPVVQKFSSGMEMVSIEVPKSITVAAA